MKKYTLLFFILLFAVAVDAQQWTRNLPNEKSTAAYSFYDYQDAFYSYWEPFNVKDGYYIDENGKRTKASGWKQFKRWEYFWESRIDSQTGELPTQDINAIFKQEKRSSAFKSSGELWTSVGPYSSDGGYAGIGRINTIAYHPTDSTMFWVGTASGGLWVTEDGGQSWSVLNDDMQALGVSDIVIPSNFATSQTIYLATGDRDAFDTRSIGLLRSIDAGANWESVGLDFIPSQGAMINRVLIDPVSNSSFIVAGNFGVYRGIGSKTKSGQSTITWTQISTQIFIDMEYQPGNFNTIYGATKTGGIFVSTDRGLNWTQSLSQGKRIALAVSPAEPTWVYAIAVNSDDGLYAIYKSIDSGVTFVKVFDGISPPDQNNLLGWDDGTDIGGQGWYDLAIAVSPTDANTVLIGGINTWLSKDGGLTWDMVNHWYGGYSAEAVHADKHYLGYQTSTGTLFEGNDGGIYKTWDYATWTDLSDGITNSQIYRLGISVSTPGETIAGLQDNGTKLLYQGSTWYDVKGGDGTECIIDNTNSSIQYGAYVNGQISKTSNYWTNSTNISANIPGGADGAWVTPYILNPKDPNKLYIGYKEIWKTSDGGSSFKQISDFQGGYLKSLAISPSDTSTLYAAAEGIIYRSINGGVSWTNISAGLQSNFTPMTYIAVKNDDPNTVWVSMSGYDGFGVFESTNGGQSWTNISDGLPNIPCNTIVQNKLNTTDVELYVGTDIGVYLKLGANPWVFFSNGLPNVVVSELEIYYDPLTPAASKLKAATYGRGLWETNVYDSGALSGTESFAKVVDAIYPNPSKGQFQIDLSDYNGEEIGIEVRSLSGKLVYEGQLNNHRNTLNLEYLANGVYVLQLKKANRWYGQNIIIQK